MTALPSDLPPPPTAAKTQEEGGLDIRALLAGIVKHWPIVAALTLLATGAALLWSKSRPRIYQASSMLEFDPNPVRPIGNQQDPTTSWMFYLDSQEMYQTQFTIVTTDAVMGQAVRNMGLQANPRFNGGNAPGSKLAMESAIASLRSRVTVEPVKNSRLFYVRVEDTDPALAAQLSHTVAHAYVDHNLDKGVNESSDAALWLGGQVDHYNTELQASENDLHEFKEKNELPSSSVEEVSKMIRLEMGTYDDALTHTKTKRKELEARESELSKVTMENVDVIPASELLANGFLQGLRTAYLTATKERADLIASGKGDNHPLVKAADERISQAKRALVDEVRNIQSAVQHDLAVIKHQEAGDNSLYEDARKRAVDLNLKELEYHRLDRQRAQNEKMYNTLLERQKEADLARRMKVNNVNVVDEPTEPRSPIRPNTLMNLGIGSLVGLVLGIALAVIREQMDSSLKTPTDVETRLNLTFVGMLPALDEDAPAYGGYGGKRKKKKTRRPAPLAKGDPALYVHDRPLSGVAEAARSLRTNLMFMNPDRPHRTLLVTSAAPSEGKTTVACSIAIAMAQSGKRTVIIDCDLRRPRLHRIFGRSGEAGVTAVLVGDASIGDVAKPALAGPDGDEIPNLFTIPAGPPPPNPADLLQSERFKKFLSDLLEHFDRVVIDSPPLAAVTDSAIVSTLVDGTIFVVRAFKTSHHLARQGLRALRDIDAPIIGAVLNAVDLTKSSYSYYYNQYYYYRREGYGPTEHDGDDEDDATAAPPPN
jgi:capsular exopolysaccharide synthesis family protein